MNRSPRVGPVRRFRIGLVVRRPFWPRNCATMRRAVVRRRRRLEDGNLGVEEAVLGALGQVVLEHAARVRAGGEFLPVGHAVAIRIQGAHPPHCHRSGRRWFPTPSTCRRCRHRDPTRRRRTPHWCLPTRGTARRGEEHGETVGAERDVPAVRQPRLRGAGPIHVCRSNTRRSSGGPSAQRARTRPAASTAMLLSRGRPRGCNGGHVDDSGRSRRQRVAAEGLRAVLMPGRCRRGRRRRRRPSGRRPR